jgi:hypothetical protein
MFLVAHTLVEEKKDEKTEACLKIHREMTVLLKPNISLVTRVGSFSSEHDWQKQHTYQSHSPIHREKRTALNVKHNYLSFHLIDYLILSNPSHIDRQTGAIVSGASEDLDK